MNTWTRKDRSPRTQDRLTRRAQRAGLPGRVVWAGIWGWTLTRKGQRPVQIGVSRRNAVEGIAWLAGRGGVAP